MNKFLLWAARKAVYTTLAAGLGAGLAYVSGKPDLDTWTISGASAALSAAVIGDLRRKYFPTVLTAVISGGQIPEGEK